VTPAGTVKVYVPGELYVTGSGFKTILVGVFTLPIIIIWPVNQINSVK